jgi:hypothetical protein
MAESYHMYEGITQTDAVAYPGIFFVGGGGEFYKLS